MKTKHLLLILLLTAIMVPRTATATLEASNQSQYYFNLPEGGIAIDGGTPITFNDEAWHTFNADAVVATSGYYKLVFAWCNTVSNSGGYHYPPAIDNLSITPVAGPVPTNLQCTFAAVYAAHLAWTENGTATAWQICLNDDETNLIEADGNPFTLTGLSPETIYTAKVRPWAAVSRCSWASARPTSWERNAHKNFLDSQ